ncbi:Hypothetical protein PBC10988_31990 [Planctomycetales bacterium 10988]|nr:Hypothetical protein PBC10988_31990 [Planctomycetales bacterium 10988]
MTAKTFHGISAKSPEEAFIIAAANSQVPVMKKLLAEGVAIDHQQANGDTALHTAAELGLLKSLRFLIQQKAKLNLIGNYELTPLMIACNLGKKKGSNAALLLINAGADVTFVRESDGMTALKFAAQECTPEVIQALIDHGADVDGPQGTDQTALMLAARSNHVTALEVLIANGADPKRKCGLPWAVGQTAQELAEMEECKKAFKYLSGLK